MRELGPLIKELREKKGTQVSVAERIGISSQLLGQYEAGRQTPKIEFFEKWKSLFNEDIRAIQKGEESTNVSHETNKHTSVHKPTDNKELSESVYRTIVEGNTEYVLVPRSVLENTKLISSDQIETDRKVMERLLSLNEKLTAKVMSLEPESHGVQKGKKNA